MKSCFISMPLGVRKRPYTDQEIDFDMVFEKLIEPAAAEAELTLLRWQTVLSAGAPFTQREALRAIIASDVLLADVSTLNPNVMYELGIRHAANRGPTVIVAVAGEPLPFYVSYIPAFFYEAQNPEGARTQLANALRTAARRSDGSPLYEFFPELHVELPPELNSEERRARRGGAVRNPWGPPKQARTLMHRVVDPRTVELVEAAVRDASEAEPAAFIDMLKGYRDAGEWDRVIKAGESPPPALARDPRVTQLVALAFTQRGREGDEEKALQMMRGLLDESGGDAEAFGIMGRIYKNRYKPSHREDDLSLAIEYYRRGFEFQPNDFYAGYNTVTLMSLLREDDAIRQNLGELLPRVKRVLQQRLDGGEVSYSLETAAIELAVIEGNWEEARTIAERALALAPTDWQREASIESLQWLGGGLAPADRDNLNDIISTLRKAERDSDEEDEFDA
jgi:tetratricopeptide (TPR) repeat protein